MASLSFHSYSIRLDDEPLQHIDQETKNSLESRNVILVDIKYYNLLDLVNPSNHYIHLNSCVTRFYAPKHLFLYPEIGSNILKAHLLHVGVSPDFIDFVIPHILTIVSRNEARFYDHRILPFLLNILVKTPYDERQEIHRAIRESSRENYDELRFVPTKKEAIEALEKVGFEELSSLEDTRSCMVCLEKLAMKEEQKDLSRMPCMHVFHRDCIVRWLLTSHYCPLCRRVMPTE